MPLPSIGVVVTTRDRPGRLRRALAAIDAQDYRGRLRIIVAYDQTPPDWQLARSGRRPLMVLANWRTPGFAGARNTGALGLDTELVAFCADEDEWRPGKLTTQVAALRAAPDSEVVTCAVDVECDGRLASRRLGAAQVGLARLLQARPVALHPSTLLVRRAALTGGLGLLAEDSTGSQNETWDLLLRAAKRAPIAHVDEPLVRVSWAPGARTPASYAQRIASLRWMMGRHPELRTSRHGSARVYGKLACWSVAAGNNEDALRYTRAAVRNNWREPRAAIALAALTGVVSIESVLTVLQRRGHGI